MRPARALVVALLLGGCATAFPPAVLEGVRTDLGVAALRANPDAYMGQRVMVGGEVLATRPRPGQTEVELLARPLRSDGAPDRTDASEGRVLIRTGEFLDPAVFAEGRRVTVVGRVAGAEERAIGDLPYRYPVIASEQLKLWSRDAPVPVAGPYPYPGYPWWWHYGYRGRPYWYGPPPYWWW